MAKKQFMMITPMIPTLVIIFCWTINMNDARSLHESLSKKTGKCPHLQNEGLHAVLDRVCEECFVMFRFMDPDVGAKCKYDINTIISTISSI